MSEFVLSLDFEDWSVVLEDNGRVAYAYLLHAGEIRSDVWLYNVVEPGSEPEWERDDAEEFMPFLNPSPYVFDASHPMIREGLRWAVDWGGLAVGGAVRVVIEDEPWAELTPGEAPGRSRLVRVDGPAARVLVGGGVTDEL